MIDRSFSPSRSFFPSLRASFAAGLAVALLLAPATRAHAQESAPTVGLSPSGQPNGTPAQAAGAQSAADSAPAGSPQTDTKADPTLTNAPQNSTRRIKIKETKDEKKADKVIQSKDTRRAASKEKKLDPLAGQDANLPDRQLYDKALIATKKGHFDVARLDLQTLLNTYPDSQYQMRAKLAIADSWYKEGGTAALTQAEAEYSDFRVFFPNSPEAAEAQMRIGDIYFRQMDKPDRDHAKAIHAEEEYRRMLTDYPDSKLVPQARQRLRDVQEALATREASIGDYYGTHQNWPATIARYQTVIDTYPQYSHMDDVLIGLGDAYAAQSAYIRGQNLPEAGKARLLTIYDGRAANAYREVILNHSASQHVEDARDRLAAMNVPIPNPSVDQAQASQALENSRSQYRLQDRARLLVFHQPDVVTAARIGDPPLVDARPTLAPDVTRAIVNDFNEAMHPGSTTTAGAKTAGSTDAAADPATSPASGAAPAPLAFQDVPSSDTSSAPTDTSVTTAAPASTGTGSTSVGAEILTPGVNGSAAAAAEANGLHAVVPSTTSLPAAEKAADAPEQVNDIQPGAAQAAAQAPADNGKKTKSPGFDKGDESSSKHKKKKGIDKINPF